MEKFEIVFQAVKQIMLSLILEGIFVIILGVLIIVYPALLNYLVAIFLIVTGILSLVLAAKLNKYSKLTVKL